MLDRWGPILVEHHAGTEANAMTMTDMATWLIMFPFYGHRSAGWEVHPVVAGPDGR